MPDPVIRFMLDVTAQCDAVLERYCANYLTGRGYYIVAPGKPWEKSGVFCKRVGLEPHKLGQIIARYEARGGNGVKLDRRGASRRVMAIQTTPEFDQFCLSLKR